MSGAQIQSLPDPDLFLDALWLSDNGRWSPSDLDDTDALLLSVIHMFRSPVSHG